MNGGKGDRQTGGPSDHQRGRPLHLVDGHGQGHVGQVEKETLQADVDDVAGEVLRGAGVGAGTPGEICMVPDRREGISGRVREPEAARARTTMSPCLICWPPNSTSRYAHRLKTFCRGGACHRPRLATSPTDTRASRICSRSSLSVRISSTVLDIHAEVVKAVFIMNQD